MLYALDPDSSNVEECIDDSPCHVTAKHFYRQSTDATALGPARALNVHVSARTMMSPDKNSETLSRGSKSRLASFDKFTGI
jgi:hypothetical protein